MTVGVYALYWEKQDLIYVGQSQDLNRRWLEHKRDMLKGRHTNYKVQETYNLYGYPEFVLLQECSIPELNDLEVYWTREYDSLNTVNGLNIIEAGSVGYGPNANNSKYSRREIILVFKFLTRSTYLSASEISKILNIPKGLIHDIARGSCHLWLQDKYPYLYSLLRGRLGKYDTIRSGRNHAMSLCKKVDILPIVTGPDGLDYEVKNIREFAEIHKIDNQHLGAVIRKQRKTHKGWKLKQS